MATRVQHHLLRIWRRKQVHLLRKERKDPTSVLVQSPQPERIESRRIPCHAGERPRVADQ